MESIQITGNKARFDNYLSSPLVIPENAKVCLNKASFSIPVWTQKYVRVPFIFDAADYDDNMVTLSLNGVTEGITWREFHTAWDAINVLENRNIANFYNGTYKLWLNNTIDFVDATGAIEKLPTFTEILAEAFSTKFAFYKFQSNDTILSAARVNVVSPNPFTLATVEYTFLASDDDIRDFGFSAIYAPEKMADKTPTTMDQYWTGANINRLGDNINLLGNPTSFAIAKDSLGNAWAIDPNGGYWNFRVTLRDDASAVTCGVIFTSLESKPDITSPTPVTEDSIIVGIRFNKDGLINTFQAVDGSETIESAGTIIQNEILYPRDKVFTFDNDVDEWFIQIRRAAGYETSANKFAFRFLHGDINAQGIDNAECFYQTEVTLPSPDILAVPAIFSTQSSGGAGTNEVKDNFIVQVDPQSQEMGLETNIFSDRMIELIPDTQNGENGEIVDFWSTIGLSQNSRNGNSKVSFNSSTFSNSINWPLGLIQKEYFVGVGKPSDIFVNNHPHLILTTNAQPELPRQIEVSLLNLAHTPHAGSFAMDTLFTEPDINKVVSYVNTDPSYFNIQSNAYLEYVYEAFNLVGRRLKNRSKLPLNQFVVQLGYKNFLTNVEQNIAQLRGVVKLEMLFDVVSEDF